ncbi:MAG: C10 family peptidase [Muribaculaceae bacterium]
MKKFVFVLLALAIILPLSAKQIGENEAINIAGQFARQHSRLASLSDNAAPELAYTAFSSQGNNFYVYNLAKGGFVIVSADDCVEQVLGYSESGHFDIATAPENMQYLLREYQNEINYAIEHQTLQLPASNMLLPVESSGEAGQAVAPLVSTKWNQSDPYNKLCPMYDADRRCVTGCAATAAAQILNYFEWPATGLGSNSYTCTINETATSLSLDFTQTTFDWANMLDIYNESATDEQNTAVATLMYNVGVAFNMNYGLSSGSTTQAAYRAFVNNFNYDRSLKYAARANHSLTEWNKMVYNELANRRPVFYAGYNSSSGHAFVCDGYSSDNFFHINWGWGGTSDGYFKLSALTPGTQGIGGSDSGYNSRQEIIYGFTKNVGTEDYIYATAISGDFKCSVSDVAAADVASTTITFSTGGIFYQYCNAPSQIITINLGVEVKNNTSDEITNIWSAETVKSGSHYMISGFDYSASQFASFVDGTYTIRPKYENTTFGVGGYMIVPYGCQDAVTMTVSSGALTFAAVEPAKPVLSATTVSTEANFYVGKSFALNLSLSNTGAADFCDNIYALIIDDSNNVLSASSGFIFEIANGDTATGRIVGSIGSDVAAGDYRLALCTSDGSNYSPFAIYNITINETPEAYSLNNGGFSFENGKTIDCNNFKTTCRVTNNGGLFDDVLYAVVFPSGGGNSIAIIPSEICIIDNGKTKDVTFSGSFDGTAGTSYLLCLYENVNSTYQQIGYAQSFTLNSIYTSIDDVLADNTEKSRVFPNPASDVVCIESPEAISGISVYTASGSLVINADGNGAQSKTLQVETLPAGVYFSKVARPTGTEVMRMVKQ